MSDKQTARTALILDRAGGEIMVWVHQQCDTVCRYRQNLILESWVIWCPTCQVEVEPEEIYDS